MKRLMSSAAVVVALSGAAYGQDAAFTDYTSDNTVDLFASDLLGARIYATEAQLDGTYQAGAETEWDDLGEINDMVINQDGSIDVVILGIGGFLGLGERDVAVQMNQLQIVRDGEDPTDYFLVVNASQDMIENAPEFSRETMEQADAEIEVEVDDTATDTATAVDDTATDAATAVDDTASDAAAAVDDTASDAATAVDNAAEATEDAVDTATTEASEALDNAGTQIEETVGEVETDVEVESEDSN